MKIGKFTVQATLGTGAHSSILQVRRAEDSRTYDLKAVSYAPLTLPTILRVVNYRTADCIKTKDNKAT